MAIKNSGSLKRLAGMAAGIFLFQAFQAQVQMIRTFTMSGSAESFTVPACVTSITADVRGAQGGGSNDAPGGAGGRAQAVISVTPGEVLEVRVGGAGIYTTSSNSGGFNGGGGHLSQGWGGTGGGASDIRRGSGLANRIIVAGGGGGGTDSEFEDRPGGPGGGPSGGNGTDWSGYSGSSGKGGTPSAGGAAGTGCCYVATAGSFGVGGNGAGDLVAGSGGGGGWYGGGGGLFGSGGGGSGYFAPTGITCATLTPGFQNGDGLIILTYTIQTVQTTATPSAICAGSPLVLSADAMLSYTWSNGANTASTTVTPSVTSTYTINATTPNNCPAMGTVQVDVTPGTPTLVIQSSPLTICPGETVQLSVTGTESYTWSGGIDNGVPFQPTVSGTYTVAGQNICGVSTATAAVLLMPATLSATASQSAICVGQTATLGTQGSVVTFSWHGAGISSNSPALSVSPTVTTVYTVSGVNDLGCMATATVALQVHNLPAVNAAANAPAVCAGSHATLLATGASSYTWNPGQQQGAVLIVQPATAGVYTVTGQGAAGCLNTATVSLGVLPLPTLQIVPSSSFACPGSTLSLLASGAVSYTWSSGVTGPPHAQVSPTVPTVYSVTGVNAHGCIASSTVFIAIMQPPVPVPSSTTVCKGDVIVLGAMDGGTYSWSTGESTQTITVKPLANTYYSVAVTVYSNNLVCKATGTIQVFVVPNPKVNVTASKSKICAGETTTLYASGAAQYTWTPAATGSSIAVSPPKGTHKYKVTGADANGCTDEDDLYIEVNKCTSVEENEATLSFVVYPNPNNGTFTIRSDRATQVALFNALGQHIVTHDIGERTNYEVAISNLSRGVYFVYATDGTQGRPVRVAVE